MNLFYHRKLYENLNLQSFLHTLKWATSDTKYLMVQDMNALKAQIKDITQDYIHYLKISNPNTEKF